MCFGDGCVANDEVERSLNARHRSLCGRQLTCWHSGEQYAAERQVVHKRAGYIPQIVHGIGSAIASRPSFIRSGK